MSKKTIAHISDLHIGCSPQHSVAAAKLCQSLHELEIDHVIVTGDVTEHGKKAEFAEFKQIFHSLFSQGKLTVVPGNHDCLNDGVAKEIMSGPRVDLITKDAISVIRVNTTGPHNRFLIAGHGMIDEWIFTEVNRLLANIPLSNLTIVALHHHLLPLPEEFFSERISALLHLPFARELTRGSSLLEQLKERCDLVLHGHRHISSEMIFPNLERSLRIYNAGSTTLLKKFRQFVYEDGKLVGEPVWIQI